MVKNQSYESSRKLSMARGNMGCRTDLVRIRHWGGRTPPIQCPPPSAFKLFRDLRWSARSKSFTDRAPTPSASPNTYNSPKLYHLPNHDFRNELFPNNCCEIVFCWIAFFLTICCRVYDRLRNIWYLLPNSDHKWCHPLGSTGVILGVL